MTDPVAVTAAIQTDEALGFSLSTLVFGAAGAVGCLISWRWAPEMGITAKITGMLSAIGLAMFGTPVLKYISGIQDQSVLFGAAGLIGVFGLTITASTFDLIRNTKWGSIIESRLGRHSETGE